MRSGSSAIALGASSRHSSYLPVPCETNPASNPWATESRGYVCAQSVKRLQLAFPGCPSPAGRTSRSMKNLSRIAGAIAQLLGPASCSRPRAPTRQCRCTVSPRFAIRHRELRIDLDRALEQRKRGGGSGRAVDLQCRAVRLQRFERRRRRLGERRRVLFDGRERFADPGSERLRDLTQRIQDVFFPRRLHLLLVEDVAGAAVPGAQARARIGSRGWRSSLRGPPRSPVRSQTSLREFRTSAAHPPAVPSAAASCWIRSSEIRLRNGDC